MVRDLEHGVHLHPSVGTYTEGLWPLEFLIPNFVRLCNDLKNASSDNDSCLMYTHPSLIHTFQSIWTDMTSLQNSWSPISHCLLCISTWINVNILFFTWQIFIELQRCSRHYARHSQYRCELNNTWLSQSEYPMGWWNIKKYRTRLSIPLCPTSVGLKVYFPE